MALISQLSVSLTARTKGLKRGLRSAKKDLKSFTNSVFNLKTAIGGALGIGGLGALSAQALNAWDKQQQAVAALEATNKSMGRTALDITDKMIQQAQELQRTGIIGDEAIIQGQGFLSTYSQISDDMLPRATRAMTDLMAKTGSSGQAAANLIGKAAMGLTGPLRIAGITLSDTTLAAAKSNKEMKKMAEQAGVSIKDLNLDAKLFEMILGDIESQIGGTNQALAKTNSGAIAQFKNSIGDIQEKIGKIVSSQIGPWARYLSAQIDAGSVSFDSFGNSIAVWVDKLMSFAGHLEQAFNGIALVVNGLKIGFQGFGLLVTTIARDIVQVWSSVAGMLGMDSGIATLNALNMAVDEQMKSVRDAKSEWGQLFDTVQNFDGTSKNATQLAFEKFRNNAVQFDQDFKSGKRTGLGKPQKVESPQIQETNKLLIQIHKKIGTPGFAVAG